jgi:hypothetical protein
MSDEPMSINVPTSPEIPTGSDNITSASAFSGAMTLDLTDEQIKKSFELITRIKRKHTEVFRRKFNDPSSFTMDSVLKYVDDFEDEIKTELAERVGVLVSVNTVPLLEGRPLEIEWLGVIGGADLEKYGQDHEKKSFEVKKATARGENYLGEKG